MMFTKAQDTCSMDDDSQRSQRSSASVRASKATEEKREASSRHPMTTLPLPALSASLVAVIWISFTAGTVCRLQMEKYGVFLLQPVQLSENIQVEPTAFMDVHQSNWSHHAETRRTDCQVNDLGVNDFAAQPNRDVNYDEQDGEDDEDDGDLEENKDPPSVNRYARHMVADIRHVDMHFLNSQERLIRAMKASAAESGTTLAAHYCFSMEPMGVSCAGELLDEGRITLHTWPQEGVITMDILTFSENSPLPPASRVKEIFGLPRGEQTPEMVWFIRARGRMASNSDLDSVQSDPTMEKTLVHSEKTPFQSIDIYDLNGSGLQGMAMSKKVRNRPPKSEQVDRVVFLDGALQSRQYGEAAYHETLAHPALFLHENPKRIAIIGGGEGATLREALKHKTVEKVVMLEIDESMVKASRTHLPQWSDCSNIAGSHSSCFDDPRTDIQYKDAISWFVDRFAERKENDQDQGFDVIIMDALDPSSVVDFSDKLYKNNELMDALSNALGAEGILVAQVGPAPQVNDEPESYDEDDQLAEFADGLLRAGFDNIVEYEEVHGRFGSPWSFLLAMKDDFHRSRWYAGTAEWNLEIQKRSLRALDGELPFLFFDSATMMSFQYPTQVAERWWCYDKPEECEGSRPRFDPSVPDIPISSFAMENSLIPNGGHGAFADEFIPKGSYLGAKDCVHSMFVPSQTLHLIDGMATRTDDHEFWHCLSHGYIHGYGSTDTFYNLPSASVDPGTLTFLNHGCNRTYNTSVHADLTETSLNLDDLRDYTYNPFFERRYAYTDCSSRVALRDIKAGEEVQCNYVVLAGNFGTDDAHTYLEGLKRVCAGDQDGTAKNYECTQS